jgi:carboxymethylenebutenolidase
VAAIASPMTREVSSSRYGTSMPDVDLSVLSASRHGSFPLRGYLVKPEGEGPWPGVVLIHEIFGVDAVMRRQTERMARAGYLTFAVDLYSAGGAKRCVVSTMRSLFSATGRAYTDIETARQWLLASEDCTSKVGVIGFCMGGSFALVSAGTGFDAAAANYGQLPKDYEDVLARACPIVGSYGAKDKSLKNVAQKLDDALRVAGVTHDVKEYDGAGHSFMNDAPVGPRLLRPLLKIAGMGPQPAAAADAWRRIEEFFAQHLA